MITPYNVIAPSLAALLLNGFQHERPYRIPSTDSTSVKASFYLVCRCSFPGELDHLPEIAFYMVGPIEEVVAKAERLAEEQKG